MMRKDPPFDMEYVYSTWLLEAGRTRGRARVQPPARHPGPQREDCHRPISTTTSRRRWSRATPARSTRSIAEHGDVILKPLDGMGGSAIFRVRHDDPNLQRDHRDAGQDGARTIMAQSYIPEIADGDKRILLIGGKPVPYSLARIPQGNGDARQSRRGRTGVRSRLTARDREIAETLAPELCARGLLLVGLDVIGDYLTEVNVTSPTCFPRNHGPDGLRCRRHVYRRAGARGGLNGLRLRHSAGPRDVRFGANPCKKLACRPD